MKKLLSLLIALICVCSADDQIDGIRERYKNIEVNGLLKLHKQQIRELEELKKKAMKAQNLELALKADEVEKELQAKISKLPLPKESSGEELVQYPKTLDYEMFESDKKRWTEKNHPIICKYRANETVGSSDKKLKLVIVVDSHPNSQSSGTVMIKDVRTDKIVAKINGLKRGKSPEIALDMKATNIVELSIACSSNDGLRIAEFSRVERDDAPISIPHILLSYH